MIKTPFLKMFVTLILILGARPLEAQVTYNGNGRVYSALLRAAYEGLKRAAAVFAPSRIITLADGGGDGGGGGDGSGGGGGSGSGDGSGGADGSGTSDGNGDASGTTDGVSADAANADPGNPDAVDAPADPTDPTAVAFDVPTNDPTMSLRGGTGPEGPFSPGFVGPGSTVGGAPGPGGVQDIAIHAVIISGAYSPWDAISKAPGVRNVTLTGGLVALGKTPRPGEIVAGGSPPSFLKIFPDPKLLNGSIIPPVVPNVIDVRIVGYSVTAEMPGN